MNLKRIALAFGFALMLAARYRCARNGRTDSPEDPTVLLALVGGAGALVAGMWRSRKRGQ